jgi:hypothetical protein
MVRIQNILTIDAQNNLIDVNLQKALLDDSFENKIEYKKYIPANLSRRMAPIVKKGVGASFELKNNKDQKVFDAIIVATGLGCLKDSIKFIDQYKDREEGLLSPTSFIQSTHNTIAGQIGLLHQNHGYNMTYVQNGLSFEVALLDALCQTKEGNNVLLGASDEQHEILEEFAQLFDEKGDLLSEAATFMTLTNQNHGIGLDLIKTDFRDRALNNLDAIIEGDPLVLYGRSDIYSSNLDQDPRIDIRYDEYSKRYLTNASFGIHLAFDLLENGNLLSERKDFDEVLVINNYQDKSFGITKLYRL